MPSLPAGTGTHVLLSAGQTLKITQSHGPQVVDTWAFSLPTDPNSLHPSTESNSATYLSTTHTRSTLLKLSPAQGDMLYSNMRMPMLTLLEDSTPGGGAHDMLFAACDGFRYRQLGVERWAEHASCVGNLRGEVAKVNAISDGRGLEALDGGWTPDPLNLFMNVVVKEEDERVSMGIQRPRSRKGDYVVLRAEVDLVVVMSACPMELNECNGGVVKDVEFEVS